MPTWIAVALGGALGALGRYGVARGVIWLGWGGLPWATLAVNLVGAGVLAFASVLLPHRGASPAVHMGLTAGMLGAFTTYSTFNLELLFLFTEGRRMAAAVYLFATVLGALAAGGAGFVLGRLAVGQPPLP